MNKGRCKSFGYFPLVTCVLENCKTLSVKGTGLVANATITGLHCNKMKL